MSILALTVEQASHLIGRGALPIDIREPEEHELGHIEGGILHPLSALPAAINTDGQPVVFYCHTGAKVIQAAPKLKSLVSGQAFMLHGGLNAWKRAGKPLSGDAMVEPGMPVSFAPGEAFRFDWSHESVMLGGVAVTVKVARVKLGYSRMIYLRAYPRESQEMVFDAHARAFEFFKGSWACGIYDNAKLATDAIFAGKEARFNRRFAQMCNYYMVEPIIRGSATGHANAQAAQQERLIREQYFTPRIKAADYDDLNAQLLAKCIESAKAQSHPDMPERTVWDCFTEERAILLKHSSRFDGYQTSTALVSDQCLVRFDNNKYSVAARARGLSVEIRAYARRLVMYHDNVVVSAHDRRFGRGEIVYDPWHYVPVAARKHGGARTGSPWAGCCRPTCRMSARPCRWARTATSRWCPSCPPNIIAISLILNGNPIG